MIGRTVVALSIMSGALAASGAQSYPGLAFDEMVRESRALNTSADTGSAVMHFLTSRGNLRVEVDGPIPDAPNLPTGKGRSVMLLTDSGNKMTFINVSEKKYLSINPNAMMESVKKMMEAMGGQIVIDTAATKLNLDSLGPAPAVDGHPILRYRLTSSFRMTMAMMGNSTTMEQHSVEEIQAAADLVDLVDVNMSVNRLADMGQTMGMAPEFMERAKAMQKKIRGFPIRVTKVQTVKTEGRTRTTSQDIMVSNIKRVQVPDSAFAVPAGYSPLAMPKLPAVDP